jgi:hypothetical protein
MQRTERLASNFTFTIFYRRGGLFKFRKIAEPIEIGKDEMNRRQYALRLQVPIVSKTHVSVTDVAVPLVHVEKDTSRSDGLEEHDLR